jgi:hypothetical protein
MVSLKTAQSAGTPLQIDCDFPGGNIILERIDGDDVYIRQDLRDTQGHWFYWYMRVQGAAGRTLRFHFTDGDVIGTCGPAISTDAGRSWSWLGREAVAGNTFRYSFATDQDEIRFAMGIPYVEENLREFLARYNGHPALRVETLCGTRRGRQVECLYLGRSNGRPKYRMLLTCRHHCCEAMASYVLEGIMEAILAPDREPNWWSEHVECLVVPFIDKDGVEAGDQGKNRIPRDHNRDYGDDSIYESVRALKELAPAWSAGLLRIACDLHCPWIRGGRNERIYQVGKRSGSIWQSQQEFARILEAVRTGELPYRSEDDLPFGQEWNVDRSFTQGIGFSTWASGLPSVWLATSIEFPYANVGDKMILPADARAFGHDLARTFRRFLETHHGS